VGHEAAHRRLKIIVADDTACDAGSAGHDARLVQNQDPALDLLAPLAQPLGQTPGRGQPMDAGTDDQVLSVRGNRHRLLRACSDLQGHNRTP
jgi:hypothetical protein